MSHDPVIDDNLFIFWAKTTHDKQKHPNAYHPLLCHMIDVAAVASMVWDHRFFARLRERVGFSLGTDPRTQIMLIAGAHDIGKASPGFQKKSKDLSKFCKLQLSENDVDRPHGLISANVLKVALGSYPASAILARITGGHHGVFGRSSELQMGRDTLGNDGWKKARHELLKELGIIVGYDPNNLNQAVREISDPGLVPILAGFISVVDWIGSNQDFFPCVGEAGTPFRTGVADYWARAQEQGRRALEKLGWLPGVTFAKEAKFDSVFANYAPNALQTTTIEIASLQTSPYLMIVEAPMGQGKTEAALYSADMAMCRGFAGGMYVSMPTQATGNSMFKRVLHDYLRDRGHQGKLNLQLVHGDALLAQVGEVKEGEISEFKPRNIGDEGDIEAQSWFTARKRPLLAPFGVGTIDQSLLCVLQTRHWFVRLFGLAGKVVIFDEVHAYDTYMNTILERLLRWLAEVDCTVILLSATLPVARRKALVKAYSGRSDDDRKPYPRITLAKPRRYPNDQTDDSPVCAEISMNQPHPVGIDFFSTDLQALTTNLSQQLENGGCAAVICNTVNRSIEIYKHLKSELRDTECMLFHARTLQMWRREREEEVLRKFGKGEKQPDGMYANRHRPHRAVLVATQVIEQSLDLDFDLMVSEIAPIDLLLQRSGRLHRHSRERPLGLEVSLFLVLCDAEVGGPPPESFGRNIEFVYARYVLLLTWLALRCRSTIMIPNEIESLVEAVYGDATEGPDERWSEAITKAKDEMEAEIRESEKAARLLLVCQPKHPEDLVEEFNSQFADDEDPGVHKMVRAATREGDPSITVVMLPADVPIVSNPGVREIRNLLDRSIKLNKRQLFKSLLEDHQCPKEWIKNAHLRYARLLRLDSQNQVRVGGYVLTADENLGVTIEKERRANE